MFGWIIWLCATLFSFVNIPLSTVCEVLSCRFSSHSSEMLVIESWNAYFDIVKWIRCTQARSLWEFYTAYHLIVVSSCVMLNLWWPVWKVRFQLVGWRKYLILALKIHGPDSVVLGTGMKDVYLGVCLIKENCALCSSREHWKPLQWEHFLATVTVSFQKLQVCSNALIS